MPEPPLGQREKRLPAAVLTPAVAAPYAELHAKSNFSFLRGASHPDELAQQAATLGYHALAITDRHSLAGVVRAHSAAQALGLKLLIGAEVEPADAPPVVLLATDRAAYGRLARLLTVGKRRAEKGAWQGTLADVAVHAEGLIALVCGQRDGTSTPLPGTPRRDVPYKKNTVADFSPRLHHALDSYRSLFGDRCYLLAEFHLGDNDQRQLARLQELSTELQLPLVAAGDVHYHVAERRYLHDVLTATRLGMTLAEAAAAGGILPNGDRYLHAPAEIAARFAACPAAVARTVEVADRCHFSLSELRYEYPEELAPAGLTPLEHLTQLTWQGIARRYPAGAPEKIRQLIEHELRLIAELQYEAFFLTVWDLVRFARERGILCQGRGSAANSAVCYALEVTSVDPDRIDVLFERFVSRERNEAPDIDVDFEHERREEVLQYIYHKYGRERAGMTAEVITYRSRSAIRDIGKALGMSLAHVDVLAKSVDHFGDDARLAERFAAVGLDSQEPVARQLIGLAKQLVGFPRHLSQHVGGMVITRGPLCELVPIENARMADRTVIEWDKDDLDELGILKVDCLALGMLTAIRKCFGLVEQVERERGPAPRGAGRDPGGRLSLFTIPPEDPAVYEMICRADTMGVFQIESRAQMSMLPRLRPQKFYDLVIEVAIVRPGPIQGNMVHPYLRRRAGVEEVTYPNDAVRQVLEKTMGVPIFQEQAMRLAVVAAGFTPGEADQLRRAMGAWRKTGVIEQFRTKLIDGMLASGLDRDFAERAFEQIRGFGEYGFPESHAASFAVLVYDSAWLKHYYPAAFCAALLNSQPMGFYAPAQLVRDAREHGVEVREIDVNHSRWDCTLETGGGRHADRPALRLGLRLVRGLPEASGPVIERVRAESTAGSFRSLRDFARRTGLPQGILTRLAQADAFRSLGLDRRTALWQALGEKPERELPLFAGLDDDPEPPALLDPMPALDEVVADYQMSGLSLKAHPISFLREDLDWLRITPATGLAKLSHGRRVRVAGLVLMRQRPSTAKGITFVTLEDETGIVNLIIRPNVWEQHREAARGAAVLAAQGILERQHEVTHVNVSKLADLSHLASELSAKSRDFR